MEVETLDTLDGLDVDPAVVEAIGDRAPAMRLAAAAGWAGRPRRVVAHAGHGGRGRAGAAGGARMGHDAGGDDRRCSGPAARRVARTCGTGEARAGTRSRDAADGWSRRRGYEPGIGPAGRRAGACGGHDRTAGPSGNAEPSGGGGRIIEAIARCRGERFGPRAIGRRTDSAGAGSTFGGGAARRATDGSATGRERDSGRTRPPHRRPGWGHRSRRRCGRRTRAHPDRTGRGAAAGTIRASGSCTAPQAGEYRCRRLTAGPV